MPADILLPLFALALLANLVLVAVAIRGMRRGQVERGRSPAGGSPANRAPAGGSPTNRAPAGRAPADRAPVGPDNDGPTLGRAGGPAPDPMAARAAAASSRPAPDVDRPLPPASADQTRAPAVSPARKPRRSSDRPNAMPSAAGPADQATAQPPSDGPVDRPAAAKPAGRSRRRFSLPPLDDDHDKVSRSIETFLGGPEGSAETQTAQPNPAPGGPTTVAIVAVDGLMKVRRVPAPPTGRDAEASDAPSEGADDGEADGAWEASASAGLDARAMVERTLRGAARASDVVSVDRHGRLRVVLAGTGELAARAYLRRVRTTAEPLLEASDDSLRLVIATATVLGGPTSSALRLAQRRMTHLLDAAQRGRAGLDARTDDAADDDDEPADPRAAAD